MTSITSNLTSEMWVISVYDAKTDVVFALDRTKTPDVHAVFFIDAEILLTC